MTLDVALHHEQGAFTLDAAFRVERGITALFGASGTGKTTLVRLIAGLDRPTRGRITADGVDLVDTDRRIWLPPHRRRIGIVFQDGQLFPHLSVRQNLAYGRLFAPRGAVLPAVAPVVGMLGLGGLLRRRPANLSGGEKQRVALGRALLMGPRLLLMDEPLAALDDARKAEILPYIERLRDEAGVSIIYVSHALAEVLRLADTVVRLDGGRVVATGMAADVLGGGYGAAAGSPLAEAGALIEAQVESHDAAYDLTTLMSAAGRLVVPRVAAPEGQALRLRIAARDVMLAVNHPQGLSALNVLAGRIAHLGPEDRGSILVTLDCGGVALPALVTRRSAGQLALAPGQHIFAVVKTVGIDPGLISLRQGGQPV